MTNVPTDHDTGVSTPDADDSLEAFLAEHESERCQEPLCRLATAERDLARLRAAFAELADDVEDVLSGRRSIHFAKVLRVKKLIVEEDDGFERVVAGSHGVHGTGVFVMTRAADVDERTSTIALSAHDGDLGTIDVDAPEGVSLTLAANGNILSTLSVRQQWTDEATTRVDGLGRPLYRAELAVDQANGDSGTILDGNGVRLHPMRLYIEQKEREERDAAVRASWAERGIVAK